MPRPQKLEFLFDCWSRNRKPVLKSRNGDGSRTWHRAEIRRRVLDDYFWRKLKSL